MLDHSYLLDGRRNHIFNYDHPGTMGPHGGPPAFKGPEALAAICSPRHPLRRLPDRPVVDRVRRRLLGAHGRVDAVVIHGRGNFYKIQGRFELDTFGPCSGAGRQPTRPLLRRGDARAHRHAATRESRRSGPGRGRARLLCRARTRDRTPGAIIAHSSSPGAGCSWPCARRPGGAARRTGSRPFEPEARELDRSLRRETEPGAVHLQLQESVLAVGAVTHHRVGVVGAKERC